MNGVLIIDKPQGFTSFDVVAVVRRIFHQKKVGHTGTLDPMATGVLPVLLGNATRAASLMDDSDKEYCASFQLGQATDTQDSTGKVIAQSEKKVSAEELERALFKFRGHILQVPPMYSAVQKNGQRLYTLARQGITVEREPRPVTIYKLELLGFEESSQSGELLIYCSKGTYVRTLCSDLGETVGSFGMMTALRRTRAAGFHLNDAISVQTLKEADESTLAQFVYPVDRLFSSRPSLKVSQAQSVRFQNGGALALSRTNLNGRKLSGEEIYRVYGPENSFLGLGRIDAPREELRVLKLF